MKIVANQNSTTAMNQLIGEQIQLASGTGSAGVSTATGLALSKAYSGGVPTTVYGIDIAGFGASGVTTAIGLNIAKQTGATNNYGIWLSGNGSGADITFGSSKSANIFYEDRDLIVNPRLAGSGDFIVRNGSQGIMSMTSVGSDILTNGTFTGSATGWTLQNWAYSSNSVRMGTGIPRNLTQPVNLDVGAIYVLEYTVSNVGGTVPSVTPSLPTQGITWGLVQGSGLDVAP